MNETLKRQLEALTSKAKMYTRKRPRACGRSSLHKITEAKEQAERFVRMLESA